MNILKQKRILTILFVILMLSFVVLNFATAEDSTATDIQASGEFRLEELGTQSDFAFGERPVFEFKFYKERTGFSKIGAWFASIFRDEYKNISVEAEIVDGFGRVRRMHVPQFQYENGGNFAIDVTTEIDKLLPGEYQLKIYLQDDNLTGGEMLLFEKDFSWGVLAFNADQSVYKSGESGYLQMGVLNNFGHTICDADLYLEITAPDGGVAELNTDNGLLQRNISCGPNNVIDRPDYFANYRFGPVGDYEIKLRAVTENGERQIFETLRVDNERKFRVLRSGPSRIYPPADYEMSLRITSDEDFQGSVVERVPESFVIRDNAGDLSVVTETDKKMLVWSNQKVIAGHELVLHYNFKAPDISPEFYLLGLLEIVSQKNIVFTEERQWQIASDAIDTYYFSTGTGTSGWTSAINAFNNSNNNYASRSIPSRSADDSGEYLTGTVNNAPSTSTRIAKVEIGVEAYGQTTNVSSRVYPLYGGSTAGPTTSFGLGASDTGVIDWYDVTLLSGAPSKWYWADVIALDARVYGLNTFTSYRTMYVDQVWLRVESNANAIPTTTIVSAVQRTNGSGVVDIQFISRDGDYDDLRARVGYLVGTSCVGTFSTSTLSETDADATATYGDPKVLNSNYYQIGNASGWIISTTTSNTVNVDWSSASNIPTASGWYCLRLIANDVYIDQTPVATTTLFIDNAKPVISNVTFSPSSGYLKIGQTATATVFTDGAGYTAGAITINNKNVAGTLSSAGGNNYYLTYTVIAGDTDRLDSVDLPVSIVLIDAQGNSNTAYTTADIAGRPGVDANLPVITNVTIPNGTYKVGSTITLIINVSDDLGDTYNIGTGCTVNGKTPTNRVRVSATTYNIDYVVAEGDIDRKTANTIPVNIVLSDRGGNLSTAFYPAAGNTATLDANSPTLSSVSIPNAIYKIGSVITATATVVSDPDTFSKSTSTINGSSTSELSWVNATTYSYTYTVLEGHADRLTPGTIPMVLQVKDAWGNTSNTVSAFQTNTSTLDATRPVIASTSFSPSSGLLKVGSSTTVTIYSDGTSYTSGTIMINGISVGGTFASAGGNNYSVTYSVAEGHNDIADSANLPVSIVVIDTSGNSSNAYQASDILGRPGVDGHVPVISQVTIPNSIFKVGSVITATATVIGDPDTYLIVSASINGVSTSTIVKVSSSTYTFSYVVAEGNTNRATGTIPMSLQIRDTAGNYSNTISAFESNTASIDANSPVLSSVSIPDLAYKVGSVITATATVVSNTDIYTINSATINGQTTSALSRINDTTYTFSYTVTEGNTDRASGTIPVSLQIKDSAGNTSNTISSFEANTASIDANSPSITTVTIPNSIFKVGSVITATATVVSSANIFLLISATINGSSTTALNKVNDTTYTFSYTVQEGQTNRATGTIPMSLQIRDEAGNTSNTVNAFETNTASIDANSPVISQVTISSSVFKVGSVITATATVVSNTDTYSINSATINGETTSALSKINDTTYTFSYTVVEGNDDQTTGNIPLSIQIKDTAGNTSNTIDAFESNSASIDANSPVLSTVTILNSSFKIGSVITATATVVSNTDTYSINSATINGETTSALSKINNTTYTFSYTVVEGNDDQTTGNIPVSLQIKDTAGNTSNTVNAFESNSASIDANSPSDSGPLSYNDKGTYSITLNLGATTTETNFSHYIIYYKQGSSGVTTANTPWDSGDDPNLGDQYFQGSSTTEITGLNAGTEYVFNIWAYDTYGNWSVSGTEATATTNYIPGTAGSRTQQLADSSSIANGSWINQNTIDLGASATDSDTSEVITLYFNFIPTGGTFNSSSTEPTGACNYGDSYGSCGTNIWFVASSAGDYSVTPYSDEARITSVPDSATGYKWQVKACDDDGACSAWQIFNASVPNMKVDTIAPSVPGWLLEYSSDSTSATLTLGTTTDEANFREYIIYYKQASSGVTENDTPHASSTDINLYAKDFNTATSTYIDTLAADTTYVFNIWAYDWAGNKASSSQELSFTTDISASPPISSFGTVSQKTDGTGKVDIQIFADDEDNDDTLRARLLWDAGTDCDFSGLNYMYLDSASVSASQGTPVVDNANVYQLGTSSGWIETSLGENTVTFDWLSAIDQGDANGSYCLQVRVNDGTLSQVTPATTTVTLDNLEPTAIGPLSFNAKTTYSLTLNLGSATTDTNFREYIIFRKADTPGVTEADTPHASSSDMNLWAEDFNSATNTTISGLNAGTTYYFKMWVYDDYGNIASTSEINATTNYIPQSPDTIVQYKNNGTTVVDNGGWTDEDNIKLRASVLDSDTSEVLTLYFEIASSTGSFVGTTTGACASTATWSSCTSKVWSITSGAGDYSATPFTGTVNPTSMPDLASGYKWQVKACDDNSVCSGWTDAGADPNFKVDNTAPSAPGNLGLASRTYNSITLSFGTSTDEANFTEYVIYWKQAPSGVTEGDNPYTYLDDGNLAIKSYGTGTSTTISGFTNNTQYVFNIWAYDEVGNGTSATEQAFYTNARPTASFVSAGEKINGTGKVDISISVTDINNDNSQARVVYEVGTSCAFISSTKLTLDETDATATSTIGDAKVLNSNYYQVGNSSGWILTSGANTVNFDWNTKTDIPSVNGWYCLRLTANDQINDQAVSATTTVYVDNKNPTTPGAVGLFYKSATNLIVSFGATTTDPNFTKYRMFWAPGVIVSYLDTEKIDSNLLNINYNNAATTSFSGLSQGQQYSFIIYAYDSYGNVGASSIATYSTNRYPTGTFNTETSQKSDGSGRVDISFEVYDLDGDPCVAKLEYVSGAGCSFGGSPARTTLDTSTSSISVDYGTTTVNNANTYQVGTSTMKIITTSGSNTVNVDWFSKTDEASANGDYCLRLTVNDGVDSQQTPATKVVAIDNLAPSVPGNLQIYDLDGLSVTLVLGASSTETNFNEYKIYYKQAVSGVTETDSPFTKINDSILGYQDFLSATTTKVSGLVQNLPYVFNIWAYDLKGNKSQAVTEISTTTAIILSANWYEEENISSPTVGPYIGKGNNVRLRIGVANTRDLTATNYNFDLEYGAKSTTCADIGSWISISDTPETDHFQISDSLYFNDMTTTTRRLSATGYNWQTGYIIKSPSVQTDPVTINAGYDTELEFTIAPTANAVAANTYCFRTTNSSTPLQIYDTYPELTLAPPPIASFVSVVQKEGVTGVVDMAISVHDDNGSFNQVKLEYESGTSCSFSSSSNLTLDENTDNISSSYGTVLIDSSWEYQVGTTSSMIPTNLGDNTVNFDWFAGTDLPGVEGEYCLRLTAFNGYDIQTSPSATTTIVDNMAPSTPGNLSQEALTSISVTLGISATSTDSYFDHYTIYWRIGSSGVTESDNPHGPGQDENLSDANWNGATTTVISNLQSNVQYVFRIWAYDIYGNKSVSEEELVVIIRYKARSENWRWYFDEELETPVSPAGDENTTPIDIVSGGAIKLRVALHEIYNVTGEGIRMRLQYSTTYNFSSDVHYVGEIGEDNIWVYADGVDEDDAVIQNLLISGAEVVARHNEKGTATSTFTHYGGDKAEFEFTVRNNGAQTGTTYYFRGFDYTNNEIVEVDTEYSYPNLITEAPALSVTISGLTSGTSTEGVTINADSDYNLIDFGDLFPYSEKIAAQRFIIDTNSGSGYQMFVRVTNNLLSDSGNTINPFAYPNASPSAWDISTSTGAFGYHTSDDTLTGADPVRFWLDNTYAGVSTSYEEIAYSSVPVVAPLDIVYRLEVSNQQQAGAYSTRIDYVVVPTF